MNRLALIATLCGGFFGDAKSQNTSIQQTEARVIFWVDRSGSEPYAETHIQFKYEGDAENINCSTGRVRFGSLFMFFAIFGIAWFNRGSRR